MIESVIAAAQASLPLRVDEVSWGDPVLSIGGQGWNFNSLSAWRLRDAEKVLAGCSDRDAAKALERLVGLSVVRVFPQSAALIVDPAFEFSDGTVLEVFGTDTFEPWTLHLPSGQVFVASPSDVNALE